MISYEFCELFKKIYFKFLGTTILRNICEGRPSSLIKNRLQHSCFPVNFVNYLRTSILKSTYEQLVVKQRYGNFSLTLFSFAFSGLLTNGGGKKAPLPKICDIYTAMMKLGKVIPHLKKIQNLY